MPSITSGAARARRSQSSCSASASARSSDGLISSAKRAQQWLAQRVVLEHRVEMREPAVAEGRRGDLLVDDVEAWRQPCLQRVQREDACREGVQRLDRGVVQCREAGQAARAFLFWTRLVDRGLLELH